MIARFWVLPSHAPLITMIFFYAALIVWVTTLIHAAQRRRWGWFAFALLVPGLGMIAYWVWFALSDRPAST